MYKTILLLSIITTFIFACSSSKKDSSEIVKVEPNKNYATYCAGCHGEKLESFVLRKFKHGETKEAIAAVIKNGLENAGMPAYSKTFNDSEINALAAYVKNAPPISLDKKEKTIFASEVVSLKIDTITTEVDVPWAMEFFEDNTMLITDRDGDFYHRYNDGRMVKIQNTPKVYAKGQGGLLDVLIHPNFKENKFIYLSYAKAVRKDGKDMSTTAITRAKFENDILTDVKEIFEARPYYETNHHYGSRMLIDKKGYLFFSVGERGRENLNPQDLKSECGKIHRLYDDGRVPEDNPYMGNMEAAPSVYSYGHRNPQGMDFNPSTGEIWENEHGPKGGDELNIICPKANYGWALTTFGINYNGTKITDNTVLPGITDPIHFWVPSIGPGDAAFITSDLYGAWKGDYMVTSLSFGFLNRCIVKNNKVIRNEKLLEEIGRMRSVKQGKDGFIYIGLENPGRVFRVRPLW
jgi:aldose sugar dehydrogenase